MTATMTRTWIDVVTNWMTGGCSRRTLAAGIWIVLRMPSFGLFLPGVLLGISLLVEGWAFLLMRRA